jgi:hypothetical protein
MPAKGRSKKQYIAKRVARVRDLYLREHLEPRDIASRLVAEGAIETTDESLESAIRLVRGDVKKIRSEIDSRRAGDADTSVALNDLDALELELKDLRKERDRQQLIADGEPIEMCARSYMPPAACANEQCIRLHNKHVKFTGPAIGVTITHTPQGPMTSYKALWPAGVRQKASKDAALLSEKISKLEIALSEKRRAIAPAATLGKGEGSADDLFQIVTSGKPMNELIAANTARDDDVAN